MNFTVKLADKPIGIIGKYDYIYEYCRGYYTNESPIFTVSVTEKDIEIEKQQQQGRFNDGVYEATCIHRAIVEGLVKAGIILIHSAVIAVDGQAYAFLAKSGVGKSTHIQQWMKHFGNDCIVLNGDKPLYKFNNGKLYVYGTPWKGKEDWGENISLPVKSFCLLERGEKNIIEPASSKDIVRKLFDQVLIPKDKNDCAVFMSMLNTIVTQVPFYLLKCNISEEAAVVAYNLMKKQ